MLSHKASSLSTPLQREWLVTNGLGGYAMGALDGYCRQTHHALLVMPVRPPLQRVMYVRHLEESLFVNGRWESLSIANANDVASPSDPRIDFWLEGGTPHFKFTLGEIGLNKSLCMPQNRQGLCVRYEMVGGNSMKLRIVPCISFRELETVQSLAEFYHVRSQPKGILVYADPKEKPCAISFNRPGIVYPVNSWKSLPLFDPATSAWQNEDVYLPAAFEFDLQADDSVTIVLKIEERGQFVGERELADPDNIFEQEQGINQVFPHAPRSMRQLVVGASQFLIKRATAMTQGNQTILAGYPDLADGGRDAMIALPGLLLTTGRFDLAKEVFSLFIKHVKHGLIPHQFSCKAEAPNYDSLDATLWMFVAIYEYWRASKDQAYLEQIYPALLEILHAYLHGLAQGVKVDPKDGLLFALEQNRPMTWMNATVENWQATPRHGKAVEVQALWHNALCIMAEFSKILEKAEGQKRCLEYADRAAESLQQKFWRQETGGLFDCLIDTSLKSVPFLFDKDTTKEQSQAVTVDDPIIRPNQVIAVGLPFNVFSTDQTRAVIAMAMNKLVTPFGLRTLAPDHPSYCGAYAGSPKRLAAARHNGCVYPWLVACFTRAYMRLHDEPRAIYEMFEPLFGESEKYCCGHLAEMYDGEAPHHPRGASAYAASTGAVLQSWQMLQGKMG